MNLGLTVLLVEDNDDVAQTVQPVLQALGCTVQHVSESASALRWLADHFPPDLLLTDVVMPGEMDGLALAQTVRDQFPSVRIVVMTGYAEQLEVIAQHGFAVLPKPWTAEALTALIKRGEGRR